MVITNPAEQLRGLPGPTEPNYQNKPATTTCREEGEREEERQGGGGGGGGREKDDIKQERGSGRQKHQESEIYFNCEM